MVEPDELAEAYESNGHQVLEAKETPIKKHGVLLVFDKDEYPKGTKELGTVAWRHGLVITAFRPSHHKHSSAVTVWYRPVSFERVEEEVTTTVERDVMRVGGVDEEFEL